MVYPASSLISVTCNFPSIILLFKTTAIIVTHIWNWEKKIVILSLLKFGNPVNLCGLFILPMWPFCRELTWYCIIIWLIFLLMGPVLFVSVWLLGFVRWISTFSSFKCLINYSAQNEFLITIFSVFQIVFFALQFLSVIEYAAANFVNLSIVVTNECLLKKISRYVQLRFYQWVFQLG